MKLNTLIDGHQWKCRVQAKVPDHLSVRPSVHLDFSLTYTLDAQVIFFFMIFTFFVENHLLGNTKVSLMV